MEICGDDIKSHGTEQEIGTMCLEETLLSTTNEKQMIRSFISMSMITKQTKKKYWKSNK